MKDDVGIFVNTENTDVTLIIELSNKIHHKV